MTDQNSTGTSTNIASQERARGPLRARTPATASQERRDPQGTLLTPDSEHAPGKHAPNRLQPAARHGHLGQTAASCCRKRKRQQASEGGTSCWPSRGSQSRLSAVRRAESGRSKRWAERARSATPAGTGGGGGCQTGTIDGRSGKGRRAPKLRRSRN